MYTDDYSPSASSNIVCCRLPLHIFVCCPFHGQPNLDICTYIYKFMYILISLSIYIYTIE